MWHIGQEIVCIKTHSQGVVKRGQTFVIKGLRSSTCKCNEVEIDVGINSPKKDRNCYCTDCKSRVVDIPYGAWWFGPRIFAPLEYDEQAIQELLKEPIEQL